MNNEIYDKRKKRLKIYYSLLITIICIIGVSYAWFKLYLSQNKDNTLASRTCFSTTFTENTSKIDLIDSFPVTDDEGINGDPFTFTIKNNCNNYVKVYITIDSEYRLSTDSAYLKDEYVKANVSPSGTITDNSVIVGKQELTDLENDYKGYILLETDLDANEEKSFDLRIWMDSKVTSQEGLNKTWAGKVVVVSSATTEVPGPNGWYEAEDGTLLAALRRDNLVLTPLTVPGEQTPLYTEKDVTVKNSSEVSDTYQNYYFTYGTGWVANGDGFDLTGVSLTSDTYANSYKELIGNYLVASWTGGNAEETKTLKETTGLYNVYYVLDATSTGYVYAAISSNKDMTEALLARTSDDYGTSYYFRGSVKNNYVEFANKCWKIVRVTGDGSIKVILHNDNINGVSNPCSKTNNGDGASLIHDNGSVVSTVFNTYYNDNAYVGFMYGTTGASDYASTHANINKSNVLTALENWYTNNLTSYESKLADVIWCNDKSASGTQLGYGDNATFYDAFDRIYSTKKITLICPNDNDGGKLSKFTVDDTTNGNGNLTYKIGLLTADELAFAGNLYMESNYGAYLSENNGKYFWWTLSPAKITGGAAYMWKSGGDGLTQQVTNYASTDSGTIRPAVALKSSTTISGGKGTSENPYVVN